MFTREGLTRKQLRMLGFLACAAEEDGRLVITANEVPGRSSVTLRALERRRLAVVDASERPYLWRVTLAGLVLARRLRGTLPDLVGVPRW